MSYYHKEGKELIVIRFKKKSKEIYLSRLKEKIFSLDGKLSYSNLTKEQKQAIYSLRGNTSIIVIKADEGSGIVV